MVVYVVMAALRTSTCLFSSAGRTMPRMRVKSGCLWLSPAGASLTNVVNKRSSSPITSGEAATALDDDESCWYFSASILHIRAWPM